MSVLTQLFVEVLTAHGCATPKRVAAFVEYARAATAVPEDPQRVTRAREALVHEIFLLPGETSARLVRWFEYVATVCAEQAGALEERELVALLSQVSL
jgi:hypothetical protein